MVKIAGNVLFHEGQHVTIEADGDINKGDPVKITGASAFSGIYIKVGIAGAVVTDVIMGVALEDISDGELGTIQINGPVIFVTGKATVTVGAFVGPSGTARQVSDVDNSVGTVAFRPAMGIAWKGVPSGTGVIPVQLMPCVFARYAS